jgi:hypothetical protein
MTASVETVAEIYKIISKYLPDRKLEKLLQELLQIESSKSFHQTILRLDTERRKHIISPRAWGWGRKEGR